MEYQVNGTRLFNDLLSRNIQKGRNHGIPGKHFQRNGQIVSQKFRIFSEHFLFHQTFRYFFCIPFLKLSHIFSQTLASFSLPFAKFIFAKKCEMQNTKARNFPFVCEIFLETLIKRECSRKTTNYSSQPILLSSQLII